MVQKNQRVSGNWDIAPPGDVTFRNPGSLPGFQDALRCSGEKDWPIEVHGQTLNFVVDTGAGVSVILAKSWDDVPPALSEKTRVSRGTGGGTTLERFTVPLVKGIQADSEIHLKHDFLFSPVCPVNLLGRDLMCKLGLVVECTGDGFAIDRFQSVEDSDIYFYAWDLDRCPDIVDALNVARTEWTGSGDRLTDLQLHVTARLSRGRGWDYSLVRYGTTKLRTTLLLVGQDFCALSVQLSLVQQHLYSILGRAL